jgi:hypothetical protein
MFIYGLRARPPGIGAVPVGFNHWTQPDEMPEQIKTQWDKSDYRHGTLTYQRQLTQNEIQAYELIDMNSLPIEQQWESFVEFCTDLVDYEVDFNDFVKDFIHPKGELRLKNPLNQLKPVDFFKLLENKGYPGKLEGLEAFYNQV